MIHTIWKGLAVITLSVISVTQSIAQDYHVYRKNKVFIGIYGGVNFSLPLVTKSHSVLLSEPSGDAENEKTYGPLKSNLSNQFGFYFSYGFSNHFSLVLQPGYHSYRFDYLTNYSWNDTVEQMNVAKEMKHRQTLSYFTVPVLVRWDFLKTRFTPYLQLGVYADILHKGNKTIYMDETIDGDVDHKRAQSKTASVDITDHLQKWNAGAIGGIGFSYYAKHFNIGLECNYRHGFLPIINNRNRYADLTGLTTQYLDVFDQMQLRNIHVQLHITFPVHSLPDLNILRRSKY